MDTLTLGKAVEKILSKSNFYSRKIAGYKDRSFEEFPFTTKKELIADQELNPPFGSNLCVSQDCIVRIHKTSGTTNKPVLIALTASDIESVTEVGSLSLRLSGVRNSDLIFHCLNYNMWAGGYTDHQSLERAGATVVPFGVGHTEYLLEMMRYLGASGIHCTPSYMAKLEETCGATLGIAPG